MDIHLSICYNLSFEQIIIQILQNQSELTIQS